MKTIKSKLFVVLLSVFLIFPLFVACAPNVAPESPVITDYKDGTFYFFRSVDTSGKTIYREYGRNYRPQIKDGKFIKEGENYSFSDAFVTDYVNGTIHVEHNMTMLDYSIYIEDAEGTTLLRPAVYTDFEYVMK